MTLRYVFELIIVRLLLEHVKKTVGGNPHDIKLIGVSFFKMLHALQYQIDSHTVPDSQNRLIHYSAFSALDRNLGPVYNTPLLRLIPGDLLSACLHRQFHTLLGLLDSWATLSNSYPNLCVPSRDAVGTIFMMVFGMTRPGREPMTYHMRGEHANHLAKPKLKQKGTIYISRLSTTQNIRLIAKMVLEKCLS